MDKTAVRFLFKMPAPTYTPAQLDLVQGFKEDLIWYGHTLSSGTNTFPCLISEANVTDLELAAEMFKDQRELSIATVLRTDFPDWLIAQTTLTDENGQSWVTVNIVDNPATISTKVWMTKVDDADD